MEEKYTLNKFKKEFFPIISERVNKKVTIYNDSFKTYDGFVDF